MYVKLFTCTLLCSTVATVLCDWNACLERAPDQRHSRHIALCLTVRHRKTPSPEAVKEQYSKGGLSGTFGFRGFVWGIQKPLMRSHVKAYGDA